MAWSQVQMQFMLLYKANAKQNQSFKFVLGEFVCFATFWYKRIKIEPVKFFSLYSVLIRS